MAESSTLTEPENLNTKNGNFICGVVEGKLKYGGFFTILML